jgi:hypothetical protein
MSVVASPGGGELTKEQLLEAYRVMRRIRESDAELLAGFEIDAGKLEEESGGQAPAIG